MELKQLLNKPLPDIPDDINLENHNITFVDFLNKNTLLTITSIHHEAGYVKYKIKYYVTMYCKMKNVTKEMLDFSFYWLL